mgnify:CR=1 FL=1
MAEFGWAYLSGAITGKGVKGALQYPEGLDGALTSSNNLVYDIESSNLYLTGTMIVSGTLQANRFDIIRTTRIDIDHSGSTVFGDDSTDTHIFTGSVSVVSGGLRNHYKKLTAASYTVLDTDNIIGVSSSAYVSITLQTAAAAGYGRVLVIKDEWNATRVDAAKIAISASGGNKIDHADTYRITGDSAALTLYSDGVNRWFIY